jgi:hypothetical protein
LMTLVSVTAYHSFSGEVEALNTPTIRRLTPSRPHQLPRITPSAPIRYRPPQLGQPMPLSSRREGLQRTGTQMTIPTHSYDHRDYEIVVSQTPQYSQAAIYPTEPNLPPVDWQLVPICQSALDRDPRSASKRGSDAILVQLIYSAPISLA